MQTTNSIREFLTRPENFEIALDVSERLHMAQDDNDPIQIFLNQADNRELAQQISDHFSAIKDELHAQFWPLVYAELCRRLEENPQYHGWQISEPDQNHLKRWVQVRIEPKHLDRDQNFLEICFEQNTPLGGGFDLYHGLRWSNRNATPYPLNSASFQSLKYHLVENGYNLSDNMWIFTISTGFKVGSDVFVENMSHNQDEFIQEMVNGPWQLFCELVNHLDPVNALARSSTA